MSPNLKPGNWVRRSTECTGVAHSDEIALPPILVCVCNLRHKYYYQDKESILFKYELSKSFE